MLAITLTAPPHCPQVSISMPKTRLSLCAQVIAWCFCARVFSCPVGNVGLALPRFADVIVGLLVLYSAKMRALSVEKLITPMSADRSKRSLSNET
jgi:hypothetical protein